MRVSGARRLNDGLGHGLPGNINFPMARNTIAEIEVYEALVWNTFFVGHLFKIANNVFTQPHRDRFFKFSRVRIFAGYHF
jgi:hypothetical protein